MVTAPQSVLDNINMDKLSLQEPTDPMATTSTAATPAHRWHGVLGSGVEAVGNTPLVRLDRIAQEEGLKCNLLAKCEYFSVGGSVKDRIAKRMVEHAEKTGVLVPGKSVVIEPTSGNTGIGLAMMCAVKGYKCIIVMPAKMSMEKEVMLRALGAEIVRTPNEASFDSPESHIGISHKLRDAIPHAVILDQYSNPNNPLAHYFGTYAEIRQAVDASDLPSKDISLFVAGAGTGGTISGIAHAIRDEHKRTKGKRTTIVAADPEGSILGGGQVGHYEVEGIGYDFFPDVLDRTPQVIDEWIKTTDKDAFAAMKRIIRKEGLFVGGSSGSALSACLRYLRSPAGQAVASDLSANVVVLLPDGVRNYMSKPWFLEGMGDGNQEMRDEIRGILGRDLGDITKVVLPSKEKENSAPNGYSSHTA